MDEQLNIENIESNLVSSWLALNRVGKQETLLAPSSIDVRVDGKVKSECTALVSVLTDHVHARAISLVSVHSEVMAQCCQYLELNPSFTLALHWQVFLVDLQIACNQYHLNLFATLPLQLYVSLPPQLHLTLDSMTPLTSTIVKSRLLSIQLTANLQTLFTQHSSI
ncbi:hypothetical protein K439DRAFT_1624093 [Ramaria rubella]|nr:hypothetical protein K439DRAFT_1624093 [Ramaria rubella]